MNRKWSDRNAPSCDDAHALGGLSVDQAHALLAEQIIPLDERGTVSLRASLDRVLAADVHAEQAIPPADNAAMDGYALRAADLDAEGCADLAVVGTAWAGHPLERAIGPGECARIMTGAPVPSGADTVVMQERTERSAARVRIRSAEAGANIRSAGEDIAMGARALAAGAWLTPARVGVLASLGLTRVPVFRQPRVALFASGDEITEPGQPLGPGRLYDSNRYTVHAMLERTGVLVDDCGHLPDERDAVSASLLSAAAEADAVLTTGGVSVGDADHIAPVIEEEGTRLFHHLAVKPGRPLHCGYLGRALFFGLPGNPVSAMVTYYQFVQPALRRLAGGDYIRPVQLQARAGESFRKRPGRTEFQRGRLELGGEGAPVVFSVGKQGSGRLSSMADANCFVVIPQESHGVEAGDWVSVQPFAGLV